MMKLPAPRLLPVTISAIAVLLIVKCGILVQAAVTDGRRADGVVFAQANAADTGVAPAAGQSPPLSPPPAHPPTGAHTKPAEAVPSQPPVPAQPPVSESERIILQALRQRRKELDTREAALAARESVLTASEQKLAGRVGELQALQKDLEGLDSARKQKEDAGWQGLVKLYEAMKPKDAAVIFNDLSMPVLLQVLDRMKDAKAAAIMAAMSPEKARDVTAELARLRTGRDVAADMAAPVAPQPGQAAPRPNPAGG